MLYRHVVIRSAFRTVVHSAFNTLVKITQVASIRKALDRGVLGGGRVKSGIAHDLFIVDHFVSKTMQPCVFVYNHDKHYNVIV